MQLLNVQSPLPRRHRPNDISIRRWCPLSKAVSARFFLSHIARVTRQLGEQHVPSCGAYCSPLGSGRCRFSRTGNKAQSHRCLVDEMKCAGKSVNHLERRVISWKCRLLGQPFQFHKRHRTPPASTHRAHRRCSRSSPLSCALVCPLDLGQQCAFRSNLRGCTTELK